MRKLHRREFLKLASAIPASIILSKFSPHVTEDTTPRPHIIIVVLDTLSARNMSLYGYPRQTTLHIENFAERSNVYHSHYSGGTFTTPGTASLLTGTYPWTHRAINLEGLVTRSIGDRNIFSLLDSHSRLAFTQNYYAHYLLTQFSNDIDRHLPMGFSSELEQYMFESSGREWSAEFRGLTDLAFGQTPGSLMLGLAQKYAKAYRASATEAHPGEVQRYGEELTFDLRRVFSGLADELARLEQPTFCYFHLFPPHAPYQPQDRFDELFLNGWKPTAKRRHALWKEQSTARKVLHERRLKYDQYVAYTDHAFDEFIERLRKTGILENSYFILTSDHGESFERGYYGHAGPYVYEPSIHIPLLISAPGQSVRRDYYSLTNSVDVLPSVLALSGKATPPWCEGKILPGLVEGEGDLPTRSTFTVEAKNSSAFGDLPAISIAMRRENFKLIHYKGYNDKNDPYYAGVFELYDLEEDPEELKDLVNDEPSIVRELKDELLSAYESAR